MASKVGEIAFCGINPWAVPVITGRMNGTAAAADRWNDPKMRANLQAAAADADGSMRVIG